MRRRDTTAIRPWLLPPLVALLICPPVAGFALGGPPLGLAIGALEAAGVLTVAARMRFEEPIEVSAAPGGYALLVLAMRPVEGPVQAQRIAEIAFAGALAASAESQAPPAVLVLAPATTTRLARWLSDLGAARFEAQRRLALSVGTLAAAGIEARGRVGDADPVQAVEDELRSFPAGELVVVGTVEELGDAVEELRRRLALPVRTLE